MDYDRFLEISRSRGRIQVLGRRRTSLGPLRGRPRRPLLRRLPARQATNLAEVNG